MRLVAFIGVAALGLLLLAEPAMADCWRLPSGQIVTTSAGSTPPIAGAQRVQCPAPRTGSVSPAPPPVQQPPRCVGGMQFNGRSCVCPTGTAWNGSQCVPQQQTSKPQPAGDPCQPYYGKGYCTDYIARKLGSRPHGDPKTWPVNRDLAKIREGVAVVFAGVTASGHVAYVERVDRDRQGRPIALHITEMNFSREPKANVPPSCLVTKNFGVVTSRTVSVNNSGITGFWPQ